MIYLVDSTIQRSNNQSMYQRVDHTKEKCALYINFLDTVVLPVGGGHYLCLITITIEVFWVNNHPLPPVLGVLIGAWIDWGQNSENMRYFIFGFQQDCLY